MYITNLYIGGKIMTMNSRKMNNYSLMRVSTVFVLTFALVVSTFSLPFGPRTEAEPLDNNPPYIPSNPDPTDGLTNVSVSAYLSWTGGDPDGDPVSYDIYLGTTSPPVLVKTDYKNTTYDPGMMNYSTKYFWIIIAKDTQNASTQGPEWQFTTESKPNSPPNQPSNEKPTNGSTNVAVNVTLEWIGGDPDEEDSVSYDVYFGDTTNPPLVSKNETEETYVIPESLDYNTVYYWRIVAWDSNNAKTIGPLWRFTTKSQSTFTVTITKPLEKKFYFNDEERFNIPRNTIVYGAITITAEVTSDSGITRVEFYADGKKLGEVTQAPYELLWKPIIQFNGLSLTRTIKVVAYNTEGEEAIDEINITKWRFHILPWLIVGAALASKLVLHTTVTGFFYNFQESRISTKFYAIRANFRTTGPFKMQRGVIRFKQCSGGFLIGPMKLTRFGLLHRFAYGSFTFIGNLHIEKLGLGQGFFSRMLQRRTGMGANIGNLLNIVRAFQS